MSSAVSGVDRLLDLPVQFLNDLVLHAVDTRSEQSVSLLDESRDVLVKWLIVIRMSHGRSLVSVQCGSVCRTVHLLHFHLFQPETRHGHAQPPDNTSSNRQFVAIHIDNWPVTNIACQKSSGRSSSPIRQPYT